MDEPLFPLQNIYDPGRAKVVTCFLWCQLPASHATSGGSVTYSEGDATHPNLHAYAHRCPWLASFIVVWLIEYTTPSSPRAWPILHSWSLSHRCPWHHQDSNSQSPCDRVNTFLLYHMGTGTRYVQRFLETWPSPSIYIGTQFSRIFNMLQH